MTRTSLIWFARSLLIQSFTASSLQIFTQTLGTRLPVHFLVGARDAAPWITPE
jgi:hypothetical protein